MRQCEVLRALASAPDHEIGTLVAAMFLGFPTLRMGPDEAKRTAMLYVSQLREFPAWAVKKACENILQDKVSGRSADFAPSVAVVVAECRALVKDLWTERNKLASVLDADVYHEPTADERQAVKDGFDKLIADLKLATPYGEMKRPDDPFAGGPDVILAKLEAGKLVPVPGFSPRLSKLLGLSPDDEMKRAAE